RHSNSGATRRGSVRGRRRCGRQPAHRPVAQPRREHSRRTDPPSNSGGNFLARDGGTVVTGLRAALVLAAGTFVEAMRNRLLMVSLLFAVVLVGASVSAASVSIGEHARLIIDVGLAAASAVGSLVAVSLTISSFAGELRRHTAYPVLARPLP